MENLECTDADVTITQKNVGSTLIIKGGGNNFTDFTCLQRLTGETKMAIKAIAIVAVQTPILTGDFFKAFPNVQEILITDCNIPVIAENALQSLEVLDKFWMIKSELTEIPGNLFRNNHELQSINISQNKLTELPDSLLQNNHKLQYFYAFSNKLTKLSPNFFDNQSLLVDVSLAENFEITPEEIREKYKDIVMANEKRLIAMREQLKKQPKYFASFAGESGITRLRELLLEQ